MNQTPETGVFALSESQLAFVTERHLATLSTLRLNGSPHVVAVAFTWDAERGIVRVITSGNSQKVRNVERTGYAAVCQVDGPNWLTLEGPASVSREPEVIADAVARYTARYRPPRENPTRVAIEIQVSRALGRA